MSDVRDDAMERALAMDRARTAGPRHASLMSIAAPAVVGIPALVLFAFALAVMGAPPDRLSPLGIVAGVPYCLCIAGVAAAWPDRVALTVCASMAWLIVPATWILIVASVVWRPGSSLPWAAFGIALAAAPIGGFIGLHAGEQWRARERRRRRAAAES